MAVFHKAHLERARLVGTDLEEALLDQAHLDDANLRRANLKGAVLRNANLCGADLRGANLEGATLIGDENLSQAAYDRSTIWPDGFDPAARGATLDPPSR